MDNNTFNMNLLKGILHGRALNLNEDGSPGDLKMYSFILSDKKEG